VACSHERGPHGPDDAFFAYQRTQDEALAWAWEAVNADGFADPERKLDQLLALLAAAPDDWQIGLLAAGPLEDLVRFHGVPVMDRIEAEARGNAPLRTALAGIWLEPGPLADRVAKIVAAT
jgi:hypothetical protein